MKKKIAFVAAVDQNMEKYSIPLIRSIKESYSDDEFDIYFFIDNPEQELTFVKYNNVYLKVIKDEFNKNSYLKKTFAKNPFMIKKGMTLMTFSRLFISIIEGINEYESVIYLDVDGLILNKLPNIYTSRSSNLNYSFYPNNKEEFSDLPKQMFKEALENIGDDVGLSNRIKKIYDTKSYFQAGLIIINNLESYDKLCKRALSKIEMGLLLDDQTILNYLNDGEILVGINDIMNWRPDLSKQVDIDDICFLHFAGLNKPLDLKYNPDEYPDIRHILKKYYNI